MSERKRLDLALIAAGLVSTRTKAQELVAEGKVLVDGKVVTKPGEKVSLDSSISLVEREHPYVSRGGLKLAGALDRFDLSVDGLRVLDVGQSTGGFTHCLLLRGAASVVGVEVGHGQLHPELARDSRVKVLEKQDIRTLEPSNVAPLFPFFVVDLSFISLRHVLPPLSRLVRDGAQGVVLVKPQFELDAERIGSGGIVRVAAAREEALSRVRLECGRNGFTVAGEMVSPVAGGDGNIEFLLWLERPSSGKPI